MTRLAYELELDRFHEARQHFAELERYCQSGPNAGKPGRCPAFGPSKTKSPRVMASRAAEKKRDTQTKSGLKHSQDAAKHMATAMEHQAHLQKAIASGNKGSIKKHLKLTIGAMEKSAKSHQKSATSHKKAGNMAMVEHASRKAREALDKAVGNKFVLENLTVDRRRRVAG